MRGLELQAIYVMWLRQMKRFLRFKSRILATFIQPLFFLAIFGSGFRNIEIPGMESDYIFFFAPGIVAMSVMFSSMFAGISILWDKQFGFLQEVLVAPVSRFSIIIGRTLGGATTAIIQGSIILLIIFGFGIPFPTPFGFIMTLLFMVLIAFTAVGFGLVIASKMRDMQSYPIIMNLVIMPLLLVSSAFFPLSNLPKEAFYATLINPLFYMVDGLRGSLIGVDNIYPPLLDFGILLIICLVVMSIGSYLFSKSEV
ncbi:MAG: ABC transporter permease [Thermoplasmatales archaeon]|nr:ABC transporter permease [Thermoplasmatales archaeon]